MTAVQKWRWLGLGLILLGVPLPTYGKGFALDAFVSTPPNYQLPDNPGPNLSQLIAGLEKASQQTPKDAQVWYQLGLAYMADKQYKDAVKALKSAVDLKPDDGAMKRNLGCAQVKQEIQADMVDTFAAAAKLDPNDEEIANDYAAALMSTRRIDQSREVVEQALNLHPRSKRLLNCLGILDAFQSQFEGSITTFQEAVAIDPGYGYAWLNMGLTNCLRHRDSEAIDPGLKGTDLLPNRSDGWELVTYCYEQINDLTGARAKLEELLKAHPDVSYGWQALGEVEEKSESYQDALASAQKAIQLKPDDGNAWAIIGNCYNKLNEPDKAMDAFEQAVKVDPSSYVGWNNLGYSQLLQGDTDKAIGSFQLSLQVNPAYENALVNLINAYKKAGKNELASEICDRLARNNPTLAASLRPQLP